MNETDTKADAPSRETLKALIVEVETFRARVGGDLTDDISSGFRLGIAACAYVDSLAALSSSNATKSKQQT